MSNSKFFGREKPAIPAEKYNHYHATIGSDKRYNPNGNYPLKATNPSDPNSSTIDPKSIEPR